MFILFIREVKVNPMKEILFFFLLFFMFSCAEENEPEFSLSGKTDDIENKTLLYLHDMVENKTIDSAVVQNGGFKFVTTLSEAPVWVMLHTKDRSKSRSIWLENNPMTFDAIKRDFRNAFVTGSESENLSQQVKLAIDTLPRSDLDKMFQEVVREHPHNVYSAFVLSNHSSFWGKEITSELYKNFSAENKNSLFGKKVHTYLKEDQSPQIGDHFVDFTMNGPEGNPKNLSDLKGKVVLLEFWASWCKPCRIENPNLVKTYEKFNPAGFEIFAVSLDTKKGNWIKAIENDGLEWQHVNDLQGDENKAVKLYGVNGIPDNLLIDRSGIVVGRNLRGEELNKKLSDLLSASE